MSTTLRHPEVSDKNQYWISRHRYYELKHFCLQFPEWTRQMRELLILKGKGETPAVDIKGSPSDPTAKLAMLMEYYDRRINLVEWCAREAADKDEHIVNMLMEGICLGAAYDKIAAHSDDGVLPISRDEYYMRYRKFFWLLSRERDPMPC